MTENMKNKDVTSLVSVVVPIYNVESYLNECVDSILFQTYKNIEVILVDDESPDSCGKICDDYEKMDTRIKVVHKKNGGLSDARNAGMKVATGDLITFVDSDDYISKDFIEILFEAMLENKSDIAMIGVAAVILISQLINENRILQYFGRISLIILCIHGPVYRIVVKIVSILLNLGTDAVRENFLLAMVVVVITMAICSTAYEVVVRLAPWMVGKKKVKEN